MRCKIPIYNYSCPKCGKEEEVIKSMKDIDVAEMCPACTTFMERMISLPTVVWKCEVDTGSAGKPTINNSSGFSNYKLGKWIEKTKITRSKENETRKNRAKETIKKQRDRAKARAK